MSAKVRDGCGVVVPDVFDPYKYFISVYSRGQPGPGRSASSKYIYLLVLVTESNSGRFDATVICIF